MAPHTLSPDEMQRMVDRIEEILSRHISSEQKAGIIESEFTKMDLARIIWRYRRRMVTSVPQQTYEDLLTAEEFLKKSLDWIQEARYRLEATGKTRSV